MVDSHSLLDQSSGAPLAAAGLRAGRWMRPCAEPWDKTGYLPARKANARPRGKPSFASARYLQADRTHATGRLREIRAI